MVLTLIDSDSFTSDGTAKKINLPAGADFFEVLNYTQMATTQTTGRLVKAEWQSGFADAAMHAITKEDSANTVEHTIETSGGFTYVTALPQPEAAVTGTAITAASPAQVTAAAHGYSNGDRVRVYGSTGMLQISGMDFTISNVATNTFELEFLDSSGFAAAATALSVRRLAKEDVVNPAVRYITNISQASQAVVTFSVDHNYVVGQKIQLNVPAPFGMVEADNVVGKVVAISSANNTVTLDVDSSAFSAFAFPASSGYPDSFPIASPIGQNGVNPPAGSPNAGYNMAIAYQSGSFVPYMYLPAGAQSPAGSNNDVIYWKAYRSE